jgi:hypothetical protein
MSKSARTIVHGLEIVDECQDVPVAHRDSLQYCDLVPDLAHVSLVQAQSPDR